VTAKVVLASTDTTNALSVALTYTTGATPTPSASATSSSPPVAYQPWHGYDGKCVDDAGNSSAIRTKIQIWTCGATDKAQYWQYSGGELQHNGLCANDKGSGGNGSKVILYTCNGASNEIWSHLANGELKLKANGGKYCLDDPAYSTHNGTQLDVWTCKDSSNQRWYQP
jgi:chitinase